MPMLSMLSDMHNAVNYVGVYYGANVHYYGNQYHAYDIQSDEWIYASDHKVFLETPIVKWMANRYGS